MGRKGRRAAGYNCPVCLAPAAQKRLPVCKGKQGASMFKKNVCTEQFYSQHTIWKLVFLTTVLYPSVETDFSLEILVWQI